MRAKKSESPVPETFVVEQILDYDLRHQANIADDPEYDSTLGAMRWEVRYLVKWEGYSSSENTWEPHGSFHEWQPSYDKQVLRAQQRNPSKPSLAELEAEATRKNEGLRAQRRRKMGAKKSAPLGKKNPAVVVKQEDGAEGGKRKKSKTEPPPPPQSSTSTISLSSAGRSTRNSLQDPTSLGELQSFIKSENAPAEVRQLAFRLDRSNTGGGKMRAPSASTARSRSASASASATSARAERENSAMSGGQGGIDGTKKRGGQGGDVVMREQRASAVAEDEIGFADSGSEDEAERHQQGQGQAPQTSALTVVEKTGMQGGSDAGFDESSESDNEVARQLGVGATSTTGSAAAPATNQSVPDGFADTSSDEDTPVVPAQALPSTSAPALEAMGFAEDSSEEDFEPPKPKQVKKVDPSRSKSKKIKDDSTSTRGKKPRAPPPPPQPIKLKPKAPPPSAPPRKASQQSRKKPRIVDSDSSDSDRPLFSALHVAASGATSAVAVNPKLAALKFQRIPKTSQAPVPPPPPAQPRPPPPPKPLPAVAVSRPEPQPSAPAPASSHLPPRLPPPAPNFFVRAQPTSRSDPSRDPRQRPSLGAASRLPVAVQQESARSMAAKEIVQAVRAPPQVIARPIAEPGYIPLSTPALENALRATNFFTRQDLPPPSAPATSIASRVRSAWRIGNPLANFFDFDAVMRGGPFRRARTAFIFASKKDGPMSKESKAVKSDYLALQLVLSTIEDVKQADSPLNPAVSAVFVHVSDLEGLGRGGTGDLAELERLREKRVGETIFVLFGEREKAAARGLGLEFESEKQGSGKERMFSRFWDTTAAITFTPKTFTNNSERMSSLIHTWSKSANRWPAQRDLFPWAHVSYLLPGGPFELPVKGSKAWNNLLASNESSRQILYDFHSLARDRHLLPLSKPIPLNSHPDTPYFPSHPDSQAYSVGELNRIAEWLPKECFFVELESLLRLGGVYKGVYLQIRRWIIIATTEEIASVKHKPLGISLLTLEQAEAELAQAPFVGPH